MRGLTMDLRCAWRGLFRRPGFTVSVVLVLALAIGGNTAVFSIVHAVMLRPLPYRDSARIVEIWRHTDDGEGKGLVAPGCVDEFAKLSGIFEAVAGYSFFPIKVMSGGDTLATVAGVGLRPGLLGILGAQPVLGRGFTPEDFVSGSAPVLISHDYWRSRLNSDSAVIGRRLKTEYGELEVGGVMPPGFLLFRSSRGEIYFAFGERGWTGHREMEKYHAMARLRPGVTPAQGQAAVNALARNLEREGRIKKGATFALEPVRDYLFGRRKAMLLALAAAVGLVLLLACTNLANMLLARVLNNQRQDAIRRALGAGRWRLLARYMAETGFLSAMGAGFGLLGANWAVEAINWFFVRANTALPIVQIDGAVLGFTLLVTLVANFLFGALPALRAGAVDLRTGLQQGSQGVLAGWRRLRWNEALVVAEVAFCLVLLVAAGLVIKSVSKLACSDLGFRSAQIVACTLEPRDWERDFGPTALHYWPRRLQIALPGVESAAIASELPLIEGTSPDPAQVEQITVEGITLPSPGYAIANLKYVSAEYLPLLRVPLHAGRYFNALDSGGTQKSARSAIINELAARRFWGARNPIGSSIRIWHNADFYEAAVVVGVVGDVKAFGARANPPECTLYISSGQRFYSNNAHLLLRTNLDAAALSGMLQARLHDIDSRLRVMTLRPLGAYVGDRNLPDRVSAAVMGWFGLSGLVLAFVGTYGLVTYVVSQRTAEIGLRTALGGSQGAILRLLLGQGFRLALLGIAAGLIGTAAVTPFLSGLLFEVSPTDPLTFGILSFLLLSVVLVATWIPARRATLIQPVEALRCE